MAGQELVIPHKLSAKFSGSFAAITVRYRLPQIITKTIDFLVRNKTNLKNYGLVVESAPDDQVLEEAKALISKLAELKKNFEVLRPSEYFVKKDLGEEFSYFNDDVDIWNKQLEENKMPDGQLPNPHESAWLLMEAYLYRKMKDIQLDFTHLKMLDLFCEQKLRAMVKSMPQMTVIAKHVLECESTEQQNEFTRFKLFMHLSLWGNKCDLSIANMDATKAEVADMKSVEELKEYIDSMNGNILCDHLVQVWNKAELLKDMIHRSNDKTPTVYLDLVADNSGYELFVDLCLLHFLCNFLCGVGERRALKVRIHLKRMPWFVSDAMRFDMDSLLDHMSEEQVDPAMKSLAERWRSYFEEGFWNIEDHKFWCTGHDYWDMSRVSPDLYTSLGKSALVIFKGDLNYRRLVGDRAWNVLTPFRAALGCFEPAPLVSLRTAKADVVVGIEDVNVYNKIQNKQLPEDWMISGDYALISYLEPLM